MQQISERGTKGLFLYLKRAMPQVYAQVAREISDAGSLQGMGAIDPVSAATQNPPSNSLADTIMSIANTAASVYLTGKQAQAQGQILQVQIDRAKAGLAPAPIDPAANGLPAPSKQIPWDKIGLLAAALLGIAFFLKGRKRA